MFTSLLIGTDQGVAVVEVDLDGCRVVHRDIAGSQIGCVAADETLALAGTHDDGLMRSLDGGRAWRSVPGQQIPHGRVTAVAVGPGSDGRRAYAGTEPSHLYVSGDRGDSWHELDALQRIPSRSEWSFPPRPWTHHVRTIAPHPQDPSLLLAGIELGGLMHSADAGASWQDHRPGAHRDTHEVVWDEHGRWCVEAAGTGAARCDDPGGDDWRDQTDGLEEKYVWSAAISSHAAGRWYVAAARGPRCAHVDERARTAMRARRRARCAGGDRRTRRSWFVGANRSCLSRWQ